MWSLVSAAACVPKARCAVRVLLRAAASQSDRVHRRLAAGSQERPFETSPPNRSTCPQDFYEDIFLELAKYGEVEYLNECDNLADHMVGNVYAKFWWVCEQLWGLVLEGGCCVLARWGGHVGAAACSL